MSETDRLRTALAVEQAWYRHKARSERRQRDRAATALRELREMSVRFRALFQDVEATAERLDRAVRGCARYRARIAALEAENQHLRVHLTASPTNASGIYDGDDTYEPRPA